MTLLVTDEPKIHCSIQDCLLQGQAQLDQRAVFRFSTIRQNETMVYKIILSHFKHF